MVYPPVPPADLDPYTAITQTNSVGELMERSEVTEAVQQAVVDALGLEADEVTPDATLLDDLGAESIDLLDILFRLERSIKIKIQAAQLAE